MSNKAINKLYYDVIEGVVAESRQDFENSGIDEETLQEMKELWRQKLSAFSIGRMAWDKDPEPAPNGGGGLGSAVVNIAASSGNNGNVSHIKQEPDASLTDLSARNATSTAALRAAQHIQQLGEENGSVEVDQSVREVIRMGALKSDMTPSPTLSGSPSGGLVLPGRGHIKQTDGPSDQERIQSDKKVLDQLLRSQMALSSSYSRGSAVLSHNNKSITIQQTDGAYDEDDDEDNQIGSDLDDPDDDDNSSGEEEEEGTMIMLCLYDKVQRVRNRWKYVLKDGIANVNGKDYTFSKATGESEWL